MSDNFDFKDYNRIARQLAGQGVDQNPAQDSKLRSSISRAYYAAFLTARKFLSLDRTIPRDRVHEFVHDELSKMTGKLKIAGQDLRTMKFKRHAADYDDEIIDLPNITNSILTKSSSVIFTVNYETQKHTPP